MMTVDISELRLIIENEIKTVEQQLLYKDAFAVGCFLHKSGKKSVGRKLCYGVLYALGFKGRNEFFSKILESLNGNEDLFASEIWAHNEINSLFGANFYAA